MNNLQDLGNLSRLCTNVNVEIITLTILYPTLLGSLPYVGPAFDLSLQRIGELYPHLHVKHTIISDKSYPNCADWGADSVNRTAAHLFRKSFSGYRDACSVTALVFAGCADVTEILPLANELDLLMITSVATQPSLRNKTITPTWIGTTSNSFSVYTKVFQNLCQVMNWTTLGIIVDKRSNTGMSLFGMSVYKSFSIPGYQPVLEAYNSTENVVDRNEILRRLDSRARVYFFFGDADEFRRILVTAVTQNMTRGEHVYITINSFRLSTEPGYLSWNKGDKDDLIAQDAYRSVLIVEPDESVYGKSRESGSFSRIIIQRSQRDYNYTYRPFESISPHPAATYASMIIVAQVLEELRIAGNYGVWSSGRKLAKLIMNRTFTTDVGDVYIDNVGERLPLVHINQLDWNTSVLRTLFVQMVPELRLRQTNETPQWPGKWPPVNEPACGFQGNAPICMRKDTFAVSIGAAVGITVVTFVVVSAVLIRRALHMHVLNEALWRVEPNQLLPMIGTVLNMMVYTKRTQAVWVTRLRTTYGSTSCTPASFSLTMPMLISMKNMSDLSHSNLSPFLGFTIMEQSIHLISEYCPRGSLPDLMARMIADEDLQTAFIFDVLRGLQAVHRSSIKFHGDLSIRRCLVDKHFTVKIGRAGYYQMEKLLSESGSLLEKKNRRIAYTVTDGDDPKSDVHAVALVIIYIVTHDDTLKSSPELRTWRAEHSNLISPSFLQIFPVLELCLHPVASQRPTLSRFITSCIDAWDFTQKTTFVEKVILRLGSYTDELDRQVAVRTLALLDERRKCDALLREMLPGTVIEQFRKGCALEAELFDSSTVMFTEINGFANVAYTMEPRLVMVFLNEVYTAFDGILNRFDVYKVETIKDSYMVVSGVPVRNGTLHAQEICGLAAALLNEFTPFQRVFAGVSLRAGIHSGQCAGGVIGLKAPRYCLFGDTVNTASRMLLHGENSRIHLTQDTANLLRPGSKYIAEDRGMTEMKGKGTIRTFWLTKSS